MWLLIHLVPVTHASTHRYTDAHTHTLSHTETYICIYRYIDTWTLDKDIHTHT